MRLGYFCKLVIVSLVIILVPFGAVYSQTEITVQSPVISAIYQLEPSQNLSGTVISTSFHTAGSPVFTAPTVLASTPLASNRLADVVRDARAKLDATRLPDIEQTKQNLYSAIARLEQFLTLPSDSGLAWVKFLKFDELYEQLRSETPNVSQLIDLEMNMRQNYPGLELSQFRDVRSALNKWIQALRFSSNPQQTLNMLDTRLEQLENLLNSPAEGAESERMASLGLIANYLQDSNQAMDVVRQIRQDYGFPNVQVAVSERFVNRMVARPLAQPSDVHECILGTNVTGTACLLGSVSADLCPLTNGISLCLRMNATVSSDNVGFNRGVRILSTGNSPVWASKQIFITPNGVSATPASVATDLSTTIYGIQHRSRLVRKIASRKAAQSSGEANRIAEGRMQNRIQSQFDEQVESQLAESNGRIRDLQQGQRPEVLRLGLEKPTWSMNSTEDTVFGNLTWAATHQLAAHHPSSFHHDVDSSISLDVHQSLPINLLDTVLGGRTIRSQDLDNYSRQITGKVPDEILKESEGEPWSVSMATIRPVALEFDNGGIKIVLRISQMTRGDRTLAEPAIISAVYNAELNSKKLQLHRQGEVDIEFAGRSGGVSATALRAFLKEKFDDILKSDIESNTAELGSRFPELPTLQLNSIQADDGWLHISLR
ncbi:MAG: hypothetical protein KDB03_03305 [Planctomycetales bacterium]|nr:hypothetical protein [Planctomycetales bacterium]